MAYHTCNEDVMSPNGTHPKAESQTATIRSQEHRRAARLKCALNVRLAQRQLCLRMSAARPDRGEYRRWGVLTVQHLEVYGYHQRLCIRRASLRLQSHRRLLCARRQLTPSLNASSLQGSRPHNVFSRSELAAIRVCWSATCGFAWRLDHVWPFLL